MSSETTNVRAEAVPRAAPPVDGLRSLIVRSTVLALALLAGGVFMVDWNEILLWRAVQRTNDATLRGDPTELSARVAGTLTRVPVADMAEVKADDVLFEIDDAPYRARVDLAAAQLADAQAQVAIAGAQIALQARQVDVAASAVELAASNATYADQQRTRQNALQGTPALRQTDLEQANANAVAAEATLSGARAAVAGAQAQLKVLQAQLVQAQAALQAKQAALDAARINLGYTRVAAPRAGRVGYRLARLGEYVAPGTPLIELVPLNDVWVVANYRETQMRNMRPGQPARVTLDAYPGVVLHGHVDSIDPGSQALGSLLPPDRSVGNFTKIAQRVPVKISIDANEVREHALIGRMFPGLSVETAVDTSRGNP
ncbi:MAG TPA: HlyD family secretion protein [Acetobacteraceae bacterium]|jgi:membrane fusion protein (multidrug efflux system)|nr:HlyD family secretion protein [Acetobacteraceae bacterium]